MIKTVELFCGMGMSALGSVAVDHSVVAACDLDRQAVLAFNSQSILPPVAAVMDAAKMDAPCDVLCGGPVCKAFSPGATVFGTEGKADERNTFPAYFAALDATRPRYAMIENSIGLARSRFVEYMRELLATIQGLGYSAQHGVVDCFHFGVPQHRHRIVFLLTREGSRAWQLRSPVRRLPGPETVGDCMAPPPEGDPWPLLMPMSGGAYGYYTRGPHMKKHPPLRPGAAASAVVASYHKGVPYGVVEMPDGTMLMCGPRLAARLQGLPDEYDLSMLSKTSALRCIGNGFPWQVAAWFLSGL